MAEDLGQAGPRIEPPRLYQENPQLDYLLRALPIMAWQRLRDGTIGYANDFFGELVGLTTEELVGKEWNTFVHEECARKLEVRWGADGVEKHPFEFECRMLTSTGDFRLFHHRAVPELDDAGDVTRWWGASVDIHDARTLAAKTLRLANDHERILESVHDGVIEISREWKVTFATDRAAQLLDSDRPALIGSHAADEFPELAFPEVKATLEQVLESGEATELDFFSERLGRWFSLQTTPTQVGLTVAIRDVTETRTLRVNLEQAQRLESIGQLTGGIAHDFNNLLTVVRGGSDALAESPGLTEDDREIIELITDSADHGAELTASLLAFARRMPLEARPTDLNRLIRDMQPMLVHTLGEAVEIRYRLDDAIPAVRVDPTQLESSLLNLIINARDAMKGHGTMSVDTREAEIDEEYAALDPEVVPGNYVIVAVSDTGSGIDPNHLKYIFDPFYTTKPVGEGTGLGLAMVSGFVKQSGGHITAYSELGMGTTFNLYLPISDVPAEQPAAPAPSAAKPHAATVLVVEDDTRVRTFACRALSRAGYTVLEAEDAEAGMRLLDSPAHVDVVFTDFVMPGGMSGRDLAEEVARSHPEIPVILTSGYTDGIVLRDSEAPEPTAMLAKPYRGSDLIGAIEEALGAAQR